MYTCIFSELMRDNLEPWKNGLKRVREGLIFTKFENQQHAVL